MLREALWERDQSPSTVAETTTEIEILAVEEVGLVETADLIERAAPDEHAGGSQRLDGDRSSRGPFDVIGEGADATEDPTDPGVREESTRGHCTPEQVHGPELASLAALRPSGDPVGDDPLHDRDLRVGIQRPDARGNAVGIRIRIGVEEQHVAGRGRRHAPVLPRAEPGVRRVREHAGPACRGDGARAVVPVVDHDHLADLRQLPRSLDARADDLAVAVRHDHDIERAHHMTLERVPRWRQK